MHITPLLADITGEWWLVIPLVIVVAIIMILIFQLLWNTTMPQVFKIRRITFWQAFRLLLLAGILFGGGWVRTGH